MLWGVLKNGLMNPDGMMVEIITDKLGWRAKSLPEPFGYTRKSERSSKWIWGFYMEEICTTDSKHVTICQQWCNFPQLFMELSAKADNSV